MKKKQVTEIIEDRMDLPVNALAAAPTRPAAEEMLRAFIYQEYDWPKGAEAIMVTRVIQSRNLNRNCDQVIFQARVSRTIQIPELIDLAPVPVEQRSWYVRPRSRRLVA